MDNDPTSPVQGASTADVLHFGAALIRTTVLLGYMVLLDRLPNLTIAVPAALGSERYDGTCSNLDDR